MSPVPEYNDVSWEGLVGVIQPREREMDLTDQEGMAQAKALWPEEHPKLPSVFSNGDSNVSQPTKASQCHCNIPASWKAGASEDVDLLKAALNSQLNVNCTETSCQSSSQNRGCRGHTGPEEITHFVSPQPMLGMGNSCLHPIGPQRGWQSLEPLSLWEAEKVGDRIPTGPPLPKGKAQPVPASPAPVLRTLLRTFSRSAPHGFQSHLP